MCTPWTDKDRIPVISAANHFTGLLFFETALAAYGPLGVTGGTSGSGDVVLFGLSFFVDPELHMANDGARLSVVASTRAMTPNDGAQTACFLSNSSFPNSGKPQCIFPDQLSDGLAAAEALTSLAHDYLRALGEVDLAVNYPSSTTLTDSNHLSQRAQVVHTALERAEQATTPRP